MRRGKPSFLFVVALISVAALTAVASDKNSTPLIGTWDYTSMTALKNGKPFGTVHFQPGQWTVTFDMDGWTMKTPSRINPDGLKGTYKVHGHDLDLNLISGQPYKKCRFSLENDVTVLVMTDKGSTITASRE